MEIVFFLQDVHFPWKHEDLVRQWILDTAREESLDIEGGEVSIIFCSDEYLLDINIQYLNHDYYTDIITFPYSYSPLTADLFISIDRVKENADRLGHEFHEELYRVIIHGILHLCGYKDKSPSDTTLMRSKEDYYLNELLLTLGGKI